jgi:ubiquinone/menaquinone biosynthesis C-methylase UbiE
MESISTKNAERFKGFADIYDCARPTMPDYPVRIIKGYLNKKPETVIDLGCGTGLSTTIWQNNCVKVIGVEPSEDMLKIAKTKEKGNMSFIKGYSHEIGVKENSVDVVVCSQSFHWMEPVSTLKEINRILKNNGVFATIDCDWPPVFNWQVEKVYMEMFNKVHEIEYTHRNLKDSFSCYDKNQHLANIKNSGYFRFSREIVFSNSEPCTAKRLVDLTLSQGSLQSILKNEPSLIECDVKNFQVLVDETYGQNKFEIEFSYRLRLGVK